jgi:hypothetical protein
LSTKIFLNLTSNPEKKRLEVKFKKFYLTKAFAKAIKKTKVVQRVADLKILSLEVSHCPGIANATGTVTIKPNDNKTNNPVNICITNIYFSPILFYMVMLYNITSFPLSLD